MFFGPRSLARYTCCCSSVRYGVSGNVHFWFRKTNFSNSCAFTGWISLQSTQSIYSGVTFNAFKNDLRQSLVSADSLDFLIVIIIIIMIIIIIIIIVIIVIMIIIMTMITIMIITIAYLIQF